MDIGGGGGCSLQFSVLYARKTLTAAFCPIITYHKSDDPVLKLDRIERPKFTPV
jgi:hypothetical protein